MTTRMPDSACARLKASISSFGYGFDAHWRDDLVKIWIHSHPVSRPRASAWLTPPAIDIWAPISGRSRSRAGFDSVVTDVIVKSLIAHAAHAEGPILYERSAKARSPRVHFVDTAAGARSADAFRKTCETRGACGPQVPPLFLACAIEGARGGGGGMLPVAGGMRTETAAENQRSAGESGYDRTGNPRRRRATRFRLRGEDARQDAWHGLSRAGYDPARRNRTVCCRCDYVAEPAGLCAGRGRGLHQADAGAERR